VNIADLVLASARRGSPAGGRRIHARRAQAWIIQNAGALYGSLVITFLTATA
jgi:hypothetical protein